MELEGFGASLVGSAIYVVSDSEHAWLPLEFISGTSYNTKILITGEGEGLRFIENLYAWNAIFRPSGRDWSVIATMIRAAAGPVLLTIDSYAPPLPASFVTFLDSMLAAGHVLTRVWIGTNVEIPAIPDALLFPPLSDANKAHAAYEMMRRLPGRNGHAAWSAMPAGEWNALISATNASNLGIRISDIGEKVWTLFWHKIGDSIDMGHGTLLKRGLVLVRTGSAIIEKNIGVV